METFDEIPKIDFSVQVDGVTVFRDALIFESMDELRNTSKAEREVMFQERYNNFLIASQGQPETPEETQPTEEQ